MWSDGSGRITDFKDWSLRRGEIAKEIQHYEIGTKPAVDPSAVKARMDGDTLKVTVTVGEQSLELSALISYPTMGEAPYPLMIGTSGIALPKSIFEKRPIATMIYKEAQVNNYSQFGARFGRKPAGRGNYDFDRLYPELKDNGAYSEIRSISVSQVAAMQARWPFSAEPSTSVSPSLSPKSLVAVVLPPGVIPVG